MLTYIEARAHCIQGVIVLVHCLLLHAVHTINLDTLRMILATVPESIRTAVGQNIACSWCTVRVTPYTSAWAIAAWMWFVVVPLTGVLKTMGNVSGSCSVCHGMV